MNVKNRGVGSLVPLVVSLIPMTALAGPFGLEMGMRLEQIDKQARPLSEGKYSSKKSPKPHPAFDHYVYQIAPMLGLCWVKAVGKDVSTGNYGLELRSAFSEMRAKLDQVYGESYLIDTLLPNSIWDEPNEFMKSLLKKERMLAARWDGETGARLPSDLSGIYLYVVVSSQESGWISVEYAFRNMNRCEREIAEKADSVL